MDSHQESPLTPMSYHQDTAQPQMHQSTHQHPQHTPRAMHLHPDFAAHMQMPHIPLPLETPLPPSAYDFTGHGMFQLPETMQGSQSHPLFEGVVAMHQMLGHDLNIVWPDLPSCQQADQLDYTDAGIPTYVSEPMNRWSASIMDPTPSPLDESFPHTPEEAVELSPDPVIVDDSPQVVARPLHQPRSSYSIFPLVVTGVKTHENTSTATANPDRSKVEKIGSKPDPYAAEFIRDKLGEQRWAIFSSRLAERRTSIPKPKQKMDGQSSITHGAYLDAFAGDSSGGATVIDFLVKVEVVKSVLRNYVPHPYNPLKTLSHAYASAPAGQVTLSRSAVLTLSGWSNTQFSYWARRAEAISVLAMHDDRLRTAAAALERRLRRLGLTEDTTQAESSSGSNRRSASFSSAYDGATHGNDPEEWVRMYVTGKGLDVIIDEVKKKTGVSPFLRGKHSSLDPFGTVSVDADGDGSRRAVVYMPTFQAEKYVHELPSDLDTSTSSEQLQGKRTGKRKASTSQDETSESEDSYQSSVSEHSGEEYVAIVNESDSRPATALRQPVSDARAVFSPAGHPNGTTNAYYSASVPPDPEYRTKKRRLAPTSASRELSSSLAYALQLQTT